MTARSVRHRRAVGVDVPGPRVRSGQIRGPGQEVPGERVVLDHPVRAVGREQDGVVAAVQVVVLDQHVGRLRVDAADRDARVVAVRVVDPVVADREVRTAGGGDAVVVGLVDPLAVLRAVPEIVDPGILQGGIRVGAHAVVAAVDVQPGGDVVAERQRGLAARPAGDLDVGYLQIGVSVRFVDCPRPTGHHHRPADSDIVGADPDIALNQRAVDRGVVLTDQNFVVRPAGHRRQVHAGVPPTGAVRAGGRYRNRRVSHVGDGCRLVAAADPGEMADRCAEAAQRRWPEGQNTDTQHQCPGDRCRECGTVTGQNRTPFLIFECTPPRMVIHSRRRTTALRRPR